MTPMTSPFKWYDKHFDRVEIVNPVPRTRTHGSVVCTSDPKVLALLKQYRDRVTVLAVELDPNSIGLQTVKSITVEVCQPEQQTDCQKK